jgi:hypothetical protein
VTKIAIERCVRVVTARDIQEVQRVHENDIEEQERHEKSASKARADATSSKNTMNKRYQYGKSSSS